MSDNNRYTGWAMARRQETQARTQHQTFDMGVRGSAPMRGAGGVSIECEDNEQGRRSVVLTARPVLLGRVELQVTVTTQSPEALRPHNKSAHLIATPDAMRDLARKLIDAADAADANRPRPKPVD